MRWAAEAAAKRTFTIPYWPTYICIIYRKDTAAAACGSYVAMSSIGFWVAAYKTSKST